MAFGLVDRHRGLDRETVRTKKNSEARFYPLPTVYLSVVSFVPWLCFVDECVLMPAMALSLCRPSGPTLRPVTREVGIMHLSLGS